MQMEGTKLSDMRFNHDFNTNEMQGVMNINFIALSLSVI